MLVLSRKQNESIECDLGDGRVVKFYVVDIIGGRVRLGLEADETVTILRTEIKHRVSKRRPSCFLQSAARRILDIAAKLLFSLSNGSADPIEKRRSATAYVAISELLATSAEQPPDPESPKPTMRSAPSEATMLESVPSLSNAPESYIR